MVISSLLHEWVREMNPEVKQLDSIPLTGVTPSFPWEELSSRLATTFDQESLTLHPQEFQWREKETLYEGLGDSLLPLSFTISPLKGQVHWVMPSQELDLLASLLLTRETHPLNLHDDALIKSFYRFLAIEVLHHVTEVPFDHTLAPLLSPHSLLPNEHALCRDISLELHGHTIWGRLMLTPEFRASCVDYFTKQETASRLSQQLAEIVDVEMRVEVGKMDLSIREWKSVKEGDFIFLDQCSLNPEKWEGRVSLTLQGKQAFRAKLKDDTLKILEFPLLQEVTSPMEKYEDEEEDFLDEYTDEFEELEEDSEEDKEALEEDTAIENEDSSHMSEEELSPPTKKEKSTSKKPLLIQDLPLTVTVEVGTLHISVEKLLQLEPGNVLDVQIHPENGVNLTVNGKLIGKGELLRIGETLGVRILELGRS